MTLKVYSSDADLVNKQLREFFKNVDVTSIHVEKRELSIHKVRKKDGSGISPGVLFMFGIQYKYSVEVL